MCDRILNPEMERPSDNDNTKAKDSADINCEDMIEVKKELEEVASEVDENDANANFPALFGK
jgi:hypothetical protein